MSLASRQRAYNPPQHTTSAVLLYYCDSSSYVNKKKRIDVCYINPLLSYRILRYYFCKLTIEIWMQQNKYNLYTKSYVQNIHYYNNFV